jgi:hypothetical protein
MVVDKNCEITLDDVEERVASEPSREGCDPARTDFVASNNSTSNVVSTVLQTYLAQRHERMLTATDLDQMTRRPLTDSHLPRS